MKRMISLCALCAVLALVTGCKQSAYEPKEPAKARTWHVCVEANKGDAVKTAGPRRVLGMDGTTVTAAWTAGDKVSAYNVTRSEALTGFLSAQSAGSITTLSGDLTGAIANGDVLRLEYLSPAYSSHDGTLTGTANSIDKVCDYAVATVTVTDASSSGITTTDAAFVNQQAIVKFTLSDADGSALPSNPTALSVNDGTSDIVMLTNIPASTYAANGAGVLYVALPAMSDKNLTLTATVGADTYTYTKSGASFANGEYFAISVWMTQQAGGSGSALSGLFSVSATTQVMFSPGNLQYQASTGTWRFAENQWDYIGDANSNISETYNGWIDLFGWGTGNAPTKTSTSYSDYSNFIDWGMNVIYDDDIEYESGTWYTMSKNEWVYLFNTRDNASSLWGQGTVCGVSGVIILPDDWVKPSGVSFYSGASDGYSDNTYTATQWSKMQGNGAVFLPAAGSRYGTSVVIAGSYGRYWSSTPIDMIRARFVYFVSGNLNLQSDNGNRNNGLSVRLVRVVQD